MPTSWSRSVVRIATQHNDRRLSRAAKAAELPAHPVNFEILLRSKRCLDRLWPAGRVERATETLNASRSGPFAVSPRLHNAVYRIII